jgi:2-haloalkanoic acid dehalogenase type II
MSRAIVFDALGTLFDLGRRERSAELMRTLHHATSLTLAGEFAPLVDLARAVDPDLPAAIAEAKPYDDVEEALAVLAEVGLPAYVLTNGGADSTRELLRRGGLLDRIADVFSVDDVRRYKPDPAPYAHTSRAIGLAPELITLVAAHAWDVVGARNAGLEAIWVDRRDEGWPLPIEPPAHRAGDLVTAARISTAIRP